MAVSEFSDRKAVVVQWDAGDYEGPVTLKLTNPESGDVSSTELSSNAGYAAVTYPLDYSGETDVQVCDADGNVLDEGSVSVS